MSPGGAVKAIDNALAQRSFIRDRRRPTAYAWCGTVEATGRLVRVIIEVNDFDFTRPPRFQLDGEQELTDRLIPHLFPADLSLCYLDRNAVVLDRYNPGGTILQCLDEATKLLDQASRGKLDADFAQEFDLYWGFQIAYADLPQEPLQQAEITFVRLRPEQEVGIVTAPNKLDPLFLDLHRKNGGGQLDPRPCPVIIVEKAMTVPVGMQWPPANLADLVSWLDAVVPGVTAALWEALATGPAPTRYLLLQAPNGLFATRVDTPRQYQTKEFLHNRPQTLRKLMMRTPTRFPVGNFSLERLDPVHVYGRNLNRMSPLAGKRIAIVGCGTIGGYMAHQLAQSGAGSLGGSLILIDPDQLSPGNLGRHILGVPYLLMNKAEALKKFIMEQLPGLKVEVIAGDVLSILPRFFRVDFIVDATGSEAVSIALNHFLVANRPKAPPALHVWMLGNGAAAQALLNLGSGSPCYKCLKPELAGESRMGMLRKDVETELVRTWGCANSVYVPYPVTASVQAAALGTEIVLDWSRGESRPVQRNRVLDAHLAHHRKDGNPSPSSKCPACSGS
jgi:molybdopterin/thiamine biosynthesis adenylyltransferase